MKTRKQITTIPLLVAALMFAAAPSARAQNQQVLYRTAQVDGLEPQLHPAHPATIYGRGDGLEC